MAQETPIDGATTSAQPFQSRVQESAQGQADASFERFVTFAQLGSSLGAERFADRMIDSKWDMLDHLGSFSFGGISSILGTSGNASVDWVFPKPWYLDELEWIAAQKRSNLQRANQRNGALSNPTVRMFDAPEISLDYVVPSYAAEPATETSIARPSGLAGAVYRRRGRIGQTSRTQTVRTQKVVPPGRGVVPSHVEGPYERDAREQFATKPSPTSLPAPLGKLAWVDRLLTRHSGAETFVDWDLALNSAGGVRDVDSTYTFEEGAGDAVVDETVPVSDEELVMLTAPTRTTAARQAAETRLANGSPRAREMVIPETAGVDAHIDASPSQAITGKSTRGVFDPRALLPASAGHMARLSMESGTGVNIALGTEGQSQKSSPLAAGGHLKRRVHVPGTMGLRTLQNVMALSARPADLSMDYVSPELAAQADIYGLSPHAIARASRIAAGGTESVVQSARFTDELLKEVYINPELGRTRREQTSITGEQEEIRRARGATLWPKATLQMLASNSEESRVTPDEKAALDVVAAQEMVRTVVDTNEVPPLKEANALSASSSQGSSSVQEIVQEVWATVSGKSYSPAVRAAQTQAVIRKLEVNSGQLTPKQMRLAATQVLTHVLMGSPEVALEGNTAPAVPSRVAQAGTALDSLVFATHDESTDIAGGSSTTMPVLRAPTAKQELVRTIVPSPKRAEENAAKREKKAGRSVMPRRFGDFAKELFSSVGGSSQSAASIAQMTLVSTAPSSQIAAKEEHEGIGSKEATKAPAVQPMTDGDVDNVAREILSKVLRMMSDTHERVAGVKDE